MRITGPFSKNSWAIKTEPKLLTMKFLKWFTRKLKIENREIPEEEIQRVHAEVRKELSDFKAQQRRDSFKIVRKSK